MGERLRYYWGRALDRLQRHGFPLRHRSLLFFEKAEAQATRVAATYAAGGVIGPVSEEEFRSLQWRASPSVVREALHQRTQGRRWAIAARRGDQMDAFCWLEADTANMFFFDMEYPIPSDTRYLARVWVCPDVRGHGLGRSLIVSAESLTADLGARRLFSACVPHNGPMRRLFCELGWTDQQGVDYIRAGPAMLLRIRADGTTARRAWSLPAAANLLAGRAGGRLESVCRPEGGRAGTAA